MLGKISTYDNATAAVRACLAEHAELVARMVRFGIVGLVVTGSYAGTTYICVRWLGFNAVGAGLLGCAAAIVVSYLGQKYFTFRSDGAHRIELPKFLVACLIAVAVSSACMWAVDHRGLDYRLGILISAILLPVCNFTVMNLWVFRTAKRDYE